MTYVAHKRSRGFSMLELLVVIFMMTILALFSAPPLVEVVRNSRLNGAARQIAGDSRQARAQAVGTGWQYRLVGFSAGAAGGYRNQYRLMSRASSAVAWPAIGAASSASSTLVVNDWVDLGARYPDVEINPGDTGQFAVTFDPRGGPTELSLNFTPLQINGNVGTKFVSVSTLGSVRVD